ncbi:hypothetical protein AQS8620_01410 [Aquimixticola soesokkakensis]|uniref:Uncharacterized protein n=1 Tax=Aquimixticola soesokkakensis TaxID=1519096 RepID=A0A1Y5SE28_9RHOB|nr:hypothetical protein [Aquimixticola soesokkakensis]SLN37885.1 hypothetical protein AQS8620_01410 [Aquimixticola soesokkakensis]
MSDSPPILIRRGDTFDLNLTWDSVQSEPLGAETVIEAQIRWSTGAAPLDLGVVIDDRAAGECSIYIPASETLDWPPARSHQLLISRVDVGAGEQGDDYRWPTLARYLRVIA